MPEPAAHSRLLPALLTLLGVAGVWAGQLTVRASQVAGPPPSTLILEQTLNKYCVTCHNDTLKTAGLAIDRLDVRDVAADAERWEKIVTKLRTGEMPPPGRPRPDAATYRAVAAALEQALDGAAAAHPDPGRVPVHRLNRSEYANAIRDLLGLEIDGRALLSSDEADQEGFDNVASVLSVSPALLENYLSAARTLSRLAVGDPALRPVVDSFKISKALVQDDRLERRSAVRLAGRRADPLSLPARRASTRSRSCCDGRSTTTSSAWASRTSSTSALDGVRVKRFTVGGEAKGMTAPENFAGNTQGDPEFEEYMHTADANLEVRVPGEGRPSRRRRVVRQSILGSRRRAAAAADRLWTHDQRVLPRQSRRGDRVDWRSVRKAATRETRRAAARCSSAVRRTPRPKSRARRKILSTLATRAYRRPVTESELQMLLGFYQRPGRGRQASFDAGIQRGIERILAAPSFLFRVEHEPAGLTAGSVYRLGDLDLASRLSFFLWSSIPDDELRNAAVRGTAERSGGAGAAGAAHAARSAVEGAGRQLRQPLARAEQARRRRPRHGALSGVRREPARRDGAGDEAVRRAASCTTTAAWWSC